MSKRAGRNGVAMGEAIGLEAVAQAQ